MGGTSKKMEDMNIFETVGFLTMLLFNVFLITAVIDYLFFGVEPVKAKIYIILTAGLIICASFIVYAFKRLLDLIIGDE